MLFVVCVLTAGVSGYAAYGIIVDGKLVLGIWFTLVSLLFISIALMVGSALGNKEAIESIAREDANHAEEDYY
ncbi:MAG: hypothetical protein O3B64_00685 [bacterium]|nr:hypothetical protein [bacterium]